MQANEPITHPDDANIIKLPLYASYARITNPNIHHDVCVRSRICSPPLGHSACSMMDLTQKSLYIKPTPSFDGVALGATERMKGKSAKEKEIKTLFPEYWPGFFVQSWP